MKEDWKQLTETQWRQRLDAAQYRVLREGGTERAFSGELYHHRESGLYVCGGCDSPLFRSDQKYDSGSGWPSFWDQVDPQATVRREDHSYDMTRIELSCARCGGHLGHVFPDGPKPTGLRYCVNSLSLAFRGSDATFDSEE